jgi:23S rRNA pseudouridine1911/1915/1917 synthase
MTKVRSEAGLHFVVDEAAHGVRLDRFLAARPDAALSRTRLKALIEQGHVAVDGAPARDPSLPVRAGQAVTLSVPAAEDPEPAGEAIALAIRHEDDHIIVIDKPAGLVVHPAAGHATGTLVNALIAHCGASLSGIGGVKRPGIVHRLDKDTSGLMVVAKTDAAHRRLAALFADHGRSEPFLREYLAFGWGAPDAPAGTVETWLGRDPGDRQRIAVMPEGRGRHAVTHWRRVESFRGGRAGAPVACLLACRLETGRTHQIRVHMAHLDHPLLGDPVYGRGFKSKANQLVEPARARLDGLGRQALHAARLGFPHPVSGVPLDFVSPLPPDLAALHRALQAA